MKKGRTLVDGFNLFVDKVNCSLINLSVGRSSFPSMKKSISSSISIMNHDSTFISKRKKDLSPVSTKAII